MPVAQKPQSGFSDFVEDAGIGTMIWGRASYFTATYYHHIVAVFTASILFLSLLEILPLPIAFGLTLPYALYFFLRLGLSRADERRFYTPDTQFIRAQISFIGISALIVLVPGADRTPLWLLYLPVILLTSKHCATTRFFCIFSQSILVLVLVRLWHQLPQPLAPEFMSGNLELIAEIIWLGFLAFILHFLVRNIQARNETIAAHDAVNALARDVGMTQTNGAQQWQPLLMALLKYLGGECASTWVSNSNTGQLQLIANARRNEQNRDEFVHSDGNTTMTVPLGGPTLIAMVARTGEPQSSMVDPRTGTATYPCPGGCPLCSKASAELVVPINLGTNQQRSTIGVLSVGFLSASFQKRLLSQYQTFMQGIVNQAKPMFVYAQRVDELTALQNVSRQVSHSLDLNQVLDNILKAIVDTLGFEFATISLVDQERKLICGARGINVPQKWLDMAVHALDSKDIQSDVVRHNKTEVISGWDDRFDRRIWSKFDHAKMIRIFTPISVLDDATHQERVIGTIEAGYHRATRAEIDHNQRRMLETLRNQASIAIEHAQLLLRAQKKADTLASLHRVGQVIASARQPRQVLEEIVRSAADLLHADIVMLYRYDRDRRILKPPVVHGYVGGSFRVNLDLSQQNILTYLLNEVQPYYSADAQVDSLLLQIAAEPEKDGKSKYTFIHRHNLKSFAGIPLIANGETVGIMFVNYRARHQFDADEKQTHELFAQQAAVAIKNVAINELERELIIREERNHLSRELHHSVSQALFGITLRARNALDDLDGQGQVRQDLLNIMDIAHTASNETGFIIDELRAPFEESQDLERGLREYVRRITKWYGLNVNLEIDLPRPLLPEAENKMVRFAREAVNNAVRHSQCRTLNVLCKSGDEGFLLSVCDDGRGFDLSHVPPGKLGLTSMHELASAVNGKFTLKTVPGAGTTVIVQILSYEEVHEDA